MKRHIAVNGGVLEPTMQVFFDFFQPPSKHPSFGPIHNNLDSIQKYILPTPSTYVKPGIMHRLAPGKKIRSMGPSVFFLCNFFVEKIAYNSSISIFLLFQASLRACLSDRRSLSVF